MTEILAAGPSSPPFGTLLLSLAAAFLYLFVARQPPSMRRTGVKTLAVALLGVLAVLLGGPNLLVAALLLSAAGDAFLAQEGEPAFLLGLGAFLAAHLAYIALFFGVADPSLLLQEPWRAVLGLVMAGLAGFALLRLWPAANVLRLPVAAYAGVILAMGLVAAMVPPPMIAVGAALFMVSDLVLAAETFILPKASPHRRWTGPFIWTTYYAAQLVLTLTALGLI